MKLTNLSLASMLSFGCCSDSCCGPCGEVTLQGNTMELSGCSVAVGDDAPDFTAFANDLSPVTLSQFKGKTVLISVVPSLDTPVCSIQTKRFNDELAKLGDDVVVITISMDLPFAQARFCSAESIEGMQVLSDSAKREFGCNYGVYIEAVGLLARAIFVVSPDGKLTYKQIVPEVTNEPDYDAALAALK